ncbi:cell division inhibitor [Pedobacter lusitanus]|uniref:Cell division inhibitor n=1 Tax=Pedobacter lusitanus TaxID=1503925 RepID=A0A0D0GQ04_9SPHI|nr:TIGR01777 family oxidoreductase [Pedobacter lusitanus]KIO76616.1 cell division inhibitor [Pedobacter lusitanus]
MNQHILLTGATGMLGRDLIKTLLKRGDKISVLSRRPQQIDQVKVFLWDVYKQEIDPDCLEGVDSIIHLAGENIAKEKWSDQRKKEIIDSRVLSTQLLYKTITENSNQVKHFISAAAVGYYGSRGDEILTEESNPGNNFLADCCVKWENAIDQGRELGLRIVKIRTGVVLAKDEGALEAMAKPIRFFAGAPLGKGKQWIPWIHYQDMTRIYIHTLDNEALTGAYNASAPFPVTNKEMTKAIAKQLHRPVWPFSVPEKVLQLILGEMSSLVMNSTHTTAQKILSSGFLFRYTHLEEALADIYSA